MWQKKDRDNPETITIEEYLAKQKMKRERGSERLEYFRGGNRELIVAGLYL